MTDYFKKYLKYKNKYLALKKGGSTKLTESYFSVCTYPSRFLKLIDSNNEKALGEGEQGSVYLFTDTDIVKIFNIEGNNRNNYKIEAAISELINTLARNNEHFPRFYDMCILDGSKAVIVMEKLTPIDPLLELLNKKADDELINTLYLHMLVIYTSLINYYFLSDKLVIHNDFKFDNFMLRQINDSNDNYDISLIGENLTIPYLVFKGIKYKLVLIDYGLSYEKNIIANSVIKFKYQDFGSIYNNYYQILNKDFETVISFNADVKNNYIYKKLLSKLKASPKDGIEDSLILLLKKNVNVFNKENDKNDGLKIRTPQPLISLSREGKSKSLEGEIKSKSNVNQRLLYDYSEYPRTKNDCQCIGKCQSYCIPFFCSKKCPVDPETCEGRTTDKC